MPSVDINNGRENDGVAETLGAYIKACQGVSGPNANPRAKFVLDSLIKHLFQFAVEVDLTIDEWLAACDTLIKSGQASSDKRNEMILISDVLGLESLLDSMAHERAEKAAIKSGSKGAVKSTDSAILGPFYRDGAPKYENGADIVQDHHLTDEQGNKGETTYVHGKVTDIDGKPIAGAVMDVWHTAPNGYYDSQDEQQSPYNNRGLFTSASDGAFAFKALRPTPYPVPVDSGAGDILKSLDRTAMRPAHIHFYVRAPGYKTLITQIFDKHCKFMAADAVFATKESLVIEFGKPKTEGVTTDTELQYDIVLVPESTS